MERKRIDSGNIEYITWYAEKLYLDVEFSKSGTFRYFKVTREEFSGFDEAFDVDSYFMDKIKKSHKFKKLEE